MGIFSNIFGKKKAFELPVGVERDAKGRFVDIEPVAPKAQVKVEINVVKNPGTSPSCVCGGGTCECAKRKADYAKAVAEKQKKASATKPAAKKPVAKTTAKKDAIKKDLADTPIAKKTPAKKKPKAK